MNIYPMKPDYVTIIQAYIIILINENKIYFHIYYITKKLKCHGLFSGCPSNNPGFSFHCLISLMSTNNT